MFFKIRNMIYTIEKIEWDKYSIKLFKVVRRGRTRGRKERKDSWRKGFVREGFVEGRIRG
jgi:hypothetical protein